MNEMLYGDFIPQPNCFACCDLLSFWTAGIDGCIAHVRSPVRGHIDDKKAVHNIVKGLYNNK